MNSMQTSVFVNLTRWTVNYLSALSKFYSKYLNCTAHKADPKRHAIHTFNAHFSYRTLNIEYEC